MAERHIAIFGSTGSIGTSTLDVVAHSDGALRAVCLSAHSRLTELCAQARQFRPQWVVATDRHLAENFDWSDLPPETQLLVGADGLVEVAQSPGVDIVVSAIVGSAGLSGTWAAVEAGKTVALANKETLVVAGQLVMQRARETGARILPVDSEHNAIFQAAAAGRQDEIRRVILTASGGPFRNYSPQQMLNVTVEQALQHPTWEMGPKITVDSATMMNKALEIIEAHWLFELPADKIEVVVHPQSIVHSMVEFRDGSVIAQLSPPDMRLPIQFALTYPERCEGPTRKFDWTVPFALDFSPADRERFPALSLGEHVVRHQGTTGVVLNAANEAAVAQFLEGKIGFCEIVSTCERLLEQHPYAPNPTLNELIELDRWTREEVNRWVLN